MPFTLAHPAAVLPLRRFLWFPGLVAGSVAPDLAYYLYVPVDTHSVHGLLLVDLLLGILLVGLGFLALAPLLALLSGGFRSRVSKPRWRLGILSLYAGSATHLLWDSFTQTHGFAVQHWPVLRISVAGPHRLYNVIGYVSSLGGLLVLGLLLVRWYRRTPPTNEWRSVPARGWILAGIAVTAILGAIIQLTDPVSQVSGYDWVRQCLLGGIQGAGLAFGFYVLAWYAARAPISQGRGARAASNRRTRS
jgi:hypothetical protein